MNGLNAANIHLWCVAGAFLQPIGMTNHLYSPHGVVTAVRCVSSGWTLVWKKMFVMSILAHICPFVQSAKMLSTGGSGWLSGTILEFSSR